MTLAPLGSRAPRPYTTTNALVTRAHLLTYGRRLHASRPGAFPTFQSERSETTIRSAHLFKMGFAARLPFSGVLCTSKDHAFYLCACLEQSIEPANEHSKTEMGLAWEWFLALLTWLGDDGVSIVFAMRPVLSTEARLAPRIARIIVAALTPFIV